MGCATFIVRWKIMNLWQVAALWLGGWVLIIVIHLIMVIWDHKSPEWASVSGHYRNEVIQDGNNLFSTGLAYFLGNVACRYIHLPFLAWIFMITGIIFCIPPIISTFALFGQVLNKYAKMQILCAFITSWVPFFMALNIYFEYIQ